MEEDTKITLEDVRKAQTIVDSYAVPVNVSISKEMYDALKRDITLTSSYAMWVNDDIMTEEVYKMKKKWEKTLKL